MYLNIEKIKISQKLKSALVLIIKNWNKNYKKKINIYNCKNNNNARSIK